MAISGQATVDRDQSLVERCRSGDTSAFDELFHAHKDRVYSVCLGILGNPDDALDALQECFTSVYRYLLRFDGRSRFATWLYRIAVNTSLQALRRAKSRPKALPLVEALCVVEENKSGTERDPAIAQALAQLPADDRAVVTLFYWQELSLPEIAEVLGCSHGAAKTRLFRARERFKQIYSAGSSAEAQS